MYTKSAKGQSGTVLLVAVTLGVLLSGFVAIALVQNLPGIFADKVNDAGPITDAESRSEYLVNGYLEQSAKYSFYQAAYNVSNATRVDESSTNDEYLFYGSGHGGWDGSGIPIQVMYSEYFDEVEDKGSDIFENYVGNLESASPKCSYYLPDDRGESYDFKVVKKDPEIGVETSSGGPLINNVTCAGGTSSVRAVYEVNRNDIEMDTKRVHIHNMAVGAFRGMSEMWNKSEDIKSGNRWQGSIDESSSCVTDGNEDFTEDLIQEQAETSAENRVSGLVEEIRSAGEDGVRSATSELGIPLIDGVISWAKINFQFNVNVLDSSTSVSEASSSWSDCNNKCEDYSCSSGFETSGTGDSTTCVVDGSLPDPDCDQGSPNGDFCENTSADSQSECGSGQTWYDGPDVCDFNGDEPCSDYNGVDTIHTYDGGGQCELDESPPEPTCDNYQREYSATYDYELSKILIHLDMLDDASVPTDLGPSVRIPLDRHFEYNFQNRDSNAYNNHNYEPLN